MTATTVPFDALPGRAHPALARYADSLRQAQPQVQTRVIPFALYEPAGPLTPLLGPIARAYRTFSVERRNVAQSLYPEYGAYVWTAWVDHLGRCVGCDDVRWIENPNAWMLPPWNPA